MASTAEPPVDFVSELPSHLAQQVAVTCYVVAVTCYGAGCVPVVPPCRVVASARRRRRRPIPA